MSPISEARKRANEKYDAKAYDKILIRIPKGEKEMIKVFAKAHQESVNGFIHRAITEAMERNSAAQENEKPTEGGDMKHPDESREV